MEPRLERVRTGLASGALHAPAQAASTPSGAAEGVAARSSVNGDASGAFNEKDRHVDKNSVLSQLLFSTFGLDHFPRYLSRWSLDEVDSLEAQLTAQLELVRQQKAAMLAAATDHAAYRREFVLENALVDSVLAPEFAEIIRRGGVAKNPAAFLRLREWMSSLSVRA